MSEWIIPCNPEYFDVFGAFEKLGYVDWSQSTPGIEKGDMVFIYVARPVQAVALRCIATEVMIPDDQADHSDEEFEKENSLGSRSHYYMHLKLDKWIPPGTITFEKMQKAGLNGNIQGPRRVPDELRELFGLESKPAGTAVHAAQRDNAVAQGKYDTEKIMRDLRETGEMDPDSHDGSYQMMRATVEAYANLGDLSAVDYRDLNVVYLTSVGTWKQGIGSKKRMIDESHLLQEDKDYLKALWDEIWRRAGEGNFSNGYSYENESQSVGMFGTGFLTFQSKTTSEDARRFIKMCVDILPMDDDNEMFDRAALVLNDSFKGMQAASVSMVLHCLKPFTFPIMNSNMGYGNVFSLLGVPVTMCYYQKKYIDNCRKIKAFRDRNFSFRNYRIFDMVAWDVERYATGRKSGQAEQPDIRAAADGEKKDKSASDLDVNNRVRGEFMKQIREKKNELEELDLKRQKLLKEIELLEGMLEKI